MKKAEAIALLAVLVVSLVVSGINPYDRLTWFLEVLPVLIGLPLVLAIYPRFQLTPMACWLIFIHCLVLMLGGHYTYARVPLGFWAQELLDLSRNHYDRLGHLAQGFIPAILTREILIRKSPLKPGAWLFFLVTSVCLAISAFYEFIEWWTAIIGGESAESFLGTQGDVWDTQWDMFLAFIGALMAQLMLSGIHDRQLERMASPVMDKQEKD
jgi:putative membrane protein